MDSQQLPSYSPPSREHPPPCRKASACASRQTSSDLLKSITLERILQGETKSPVTKKDLLRWLECCRRKAVSRGDHEKAEEAEMGRRIIQFLSEVEVYKGSFNALPVEKSSLAPPPFQVISQIAHTNSEIMRPPPVRSPNNSLRAAASPAGQYQEPRPFDSPNVGHGRDKSSESFETWSSGSTIARRRGESSASESFTEIVSKEASTLGLERADSDRPELTSPRILPRAHRLRSPSAISASSTLGISGLSIGASSAMGSSRSTAGGLARQAYTAGGLSNPGNYQREMDWSRRDTIALQGDPLAPPPPFESMGLGAFGGNGSNPRRPSENMLSRPLSPIPSPSLSPRPLSPCPSTHSVELPEGLDPGVQALRQPLASLTKLYLQPNSSCSVVPLIPPRILATFVSESSLTTHPETMGPIVTVLSEMFSLNPSLLPAFLQASAQNLHRNTAMGRLMVGVACCVVGVAVGICLILDPSPFDLHGPPVDRLWRLIVIPILLGGVGYGMGAKASLCFWLAFFGVTEETYSPSHPPLSPSQALALLSSAIIDRLPCEFVRNKQRKVRPISERRISRKLKKRSVSSLQDGNPFGPGDAAVAGFGLSMSMTRSRSVSNPTPATALLASSGSANLKDYSIWVLLWRLTGTAWGVKKVEDPFLQRYQRREAWKIAGQLALALSVIGVAFFFVPYIPLPPK
ncbi:hypothetical protein IAR50_006407 [Cryptococcus sp. DSM 104548]